MTNTYYGVTKLSKIDDWKPVVSEKNWKQSRSAFELAHAWGKADGFPSSVQSAFKKDKSNLFSHLSVHHGIVEMPVFLDSKKAPSMTDLMLYCADEFEKPVIIGVEGKSTESFDKEISIWIQNDKNEVAPTRVSRLLFLNEKLGTEVPVDSNLRYQLLHRTYSVIAECQRVGAQHGIVLIHSFSDKNPENWKDFLKFTSFLGVNDVEKGVIKTWNREKPLIHFLWIEDHPKQPS